jgi:hypothetical protein
MVVSDVTVVPVIGWSDGWATRLGDAVLAYDRGEQLVFETPEDAADFASYAVYHTMTAEEKAARQRAITDRIKARLAEDQAALEAWLDGDSTALDDLPF